jgi:uncharacterized protein
MCNLRCSYCFYHDIAHNREKVDYGFMSLETLEIIMKKALLNAVDYASFTYQGGEPTLIGLDFFKHSISLQEKYNVHGVTIHNSIQTNGYKLTDEWAKFFKDNNFLVGISLDGLKKTHDKCRKNAAGEGSFTDIMEGINLLWKYKVDFNILTVVNSVTARKISEIYHFYSRKGFSYLQFIPCLDPIQESADQLEYYLDAETYGDFLITLFELWYEDLNQGKWIHIREIENYIQVLAGYPAEACGMSGSCNIQNVIEADGSIYPCDFYVLDTYRLGNIRDSDFLEIWKSEDTKRFINDSIPLSNKCLSCKYYQLCRGGCKRYRTVFTEGAYLNKFCNSYERFFDATLSRMQRIAMQFKR